MGKVIILKKAEKPKKKPLSLRDQKVVALVATGGKSKATILKKAGYSAKTARTPSKVFDKAEVKEAIEPILDRLIKHRDKVLKRMEEIVNTAGYTPLSITLSNLNKDIELLAGRPTEIQRQELDPERKAQIDELFKRMKNK